MLQEGIQKKKKRERERERFKTYFYERINTDQ